MDDFGDYGGFDLNDDSADTGGWGFGNDIDLTDTSTDTGDTGWDGTGGYTPSMEFGSDTSNSATGGTDSGGSDMWGSVASGAAAGSAFGPWGTVIGAGLGLVSSYFGGKAKSQAQKDQEKLNEKEYAAKRAIDEQYYQAHGKQLVDAYQGYKKFNTGDAGQQPLGLAAPGGPSGYFH